MVAEADTPDGSEPEDDSGIVVPKRSKFRPEYLKHVERWGKEGLTTREIATNLGVTEQTFYNWLSSFPDLVIAHRLGKEASDERVTRSLYHRAIGYTFDSEKVFQFQGSEVRVPVVEHVPPDTNAAVFWLKNRRPKEWRERVEQDVTHTLHLSDSVQALVSNLREQRDVTPEVEIVQPLPALELPEGKIEPAGGF